MIPASLAWHRRRYFLTLARASRSELREWMSRRAAMLHVSGTPPAAAVRKSVKSIRVGLRSLGA